VRACGRRRRLRSTRPAAKCSRRPALAHPSVGARYPSRPGCWSGCRTLIWMPGPPHGLRSSSGATRGRGSTPSYGTSLASASTVSGGPCSNPIGARCYCRSQAWDCRQRSARPLPSCRVDTGSTVAIERAVTRTHHRPQIDCAFRHSSPRIPQKTSHWNR